MNNGQRGFFTIEVLLGAALSTVILMSIFSSYLLMKDLYLKQCLIADEQENIRTLYLFLKELIHDSTEIKAYSHHEAPSSLRILSDVLEIKSKDHVYKLYVRETLRNKLTSLYLKKDALNAQEFIPKLSIFSVNKDNNSNKLLYVKIKFNTKEIPMIFECNKSAL